MSFPPQVKEQVLVASGRRCALCLRFCGMKIELHHIELHSEGGQDTFTNCIPLCFDCHADQRSYDHKHPKGTRYTATELKHHRDRLYRQISSGAISSVADSAPSPAVVGSNVTYGSIIVTQNQSGGQTAHTINNYRPAQRILTPEVKDTIVDILRSDRRLGIGFASTQGDAEAHRFKLQLMELFSSAGWEVRDLHTFMLLGHVEGLKLNVSPDWSDQRLFEIVAQALLLTGNPLTYGNDSNAEGCGGFHVEVWSAVDDGSGPDR